LLLGNQTIKKWPEKIKLLQSGFALARESEVGLGIGIDCESSIKKPLPDDVHPFVSM
jgi:hypothetical protein